MKKIDEQVKCRFNIHHSQLTTHKLTKAQEAFRRWHLPK